MDPEVTTAYIHSLTQSLLLEWRRLLVLQEIEAAATAAIANTTTLPGLANIARDLHSIQADLANIEARLADISSPDVLAVAAAAVAAAAVAARAMANTTALAGVANIEADLANIQAHFANISSPDVLAESSSSSAAAAAKWRRRRRRNRRRLLLVDLAYTETYLANISDNLAEIEANLAIITSQDVLATAAEAAAAAAAAPAMAKTTTLEVKTDSECGQCSVCLEDYIVGTIVRELPCKHMFHDECVSDWIQRPSSSRNCPDCRYQL